MCTTMLYVFIATIFARNVICAEMETCHYGSKSSLKSMNAQPPSLLLLVPNGDMKSIRVASINGPYLGFDESIFNSLLDIHPKIIPTCSSVEDLDKSEEISETTMEADRSSTDMTGLTEVNTSTDESDVQTSPDNQESSELLTQLLSDLMIVQETFNDQIQKETTISENSDEEMEDTDEVEMTTNEKLDDVVEVGSQCQEAVSNFFESIFDSMSTLFTSCMSELQGISKAKTSQAFLRMKDEITSKLRNKRMWPMTFSQEQLAEIKQSLWSLLPALTANNDELSEDFRKLASRLRNTNKTEHPSV
ncbi:hypothetical protein ACOME3_004018 [Neoechinorhynchus agilis]